MQSLKQLHDEAMTLVKSGNSSEIEQLLTRLKAMEKSMVINKLITICENKLNESVDNVIQMSEYRNRRMKK